MREVALHYRGLGFRSIRYRPVPLMYHRVPAQDDLYALFTLQALRRLVDLSLDDRTWPAAQP